MATTPRRDAGLHVARLDHVHDLTWLVGESMAEDTNYTSVDCRFFGTMWIEFIMAGADSEAGDLFIEYSMDDVTFYPFAIDAGKFAVIDPGSNLTVVEAEGKVTVAALAAETRFSMGVEKPPPFLRGRWDFTAGGATAMSGTNLGRG